MRTRSEPVPELLDRMRSLMLVVAAEPIGDSMVVWRAAERLGIAVSAVAAAEADGLLEIGARVRFRHPLDLVAYFDDHTLTVTTTEAA